ncbi:MAG: methyltransferase domain-containing protein [Syntrophobacteraceae bacterium]|jgi:SAM-dependent methyltransferase
MKKHIRKYYEQLYQGKKGAKVRGSAGRSLALELDYPAGLIDFIPEEIWEDFLPCGNVLPYINPKSGDRLLNLGCGAGVDSIVLKLSACADLTIVNLDSALPVLIKACGLAGRFFPDLGFEFICADGCGLPLGPGSFDWIILNGVFNLFPEKGELIAEVYRVLKLGGVVAGADLCRRVILPDYFASEPDAWAWCMSGALSQDELSAAFEAGGFTKLDLVRENIDDYFDRAVFAFRKTGRQGACNRRGQLSF